MNSLIKSILLFAAVAPLPHSLPAATRDSDIPSQLEALRGLDARILAIGDRLATANAALCPDRAPVTGLTVHDLSQYGPEYRASAAALFGLGSRPAVAAVDPDSAAARAGVATGDTLVAADGHAFAEAPPATSAATFEQAELALDTLDAAFADGEADLDLLRAGAPIKVHVAAPQGCRGRFQLVPGSKLNAGADGRYIQISSALTLYAQSDDELAAILAHELAHNILGHRQRLKAAKVSHGLFESVGRNARLIRETEVEADRLSVYLLDRAGYSIAGATDFWSRFGPEHGHGILASPTHPGWEKRVATIEQEEAALARLKQTDPRPVPPMLLEPPAALK